MRFLIVNGPNLNLLGTREPEVYGSDTLLDLERRWRRHAARRGVGVHTFQTNHEGAIIDALHTDGARSDGVILNPGAYSHTSYAIHDAIAAIDPPTVEVHISNIHAREPWRAVSVTAPATEHMIYGRGPVGYLNAMDHLWARLTVPPVRLAYGDHPDQVVDLRIPDRARGVAVLIHGGFWRSQWTADIMDPLAVALHAEGWATATVEYRRGPGSFADATSDTATAIDRVREELDATAAAPPMVLVGHSAGGYLALRQATPPAAPPVLALAPVVDLPGLSAIRPDDDPVAAFLGGSVDEAPDVWRSAALGDLPADRISLLHGSADESVPAAHSLAWHERRPELGVRILEDVDHMSLIDPLQPAYDDVLAALEALIAT